MELVKTVRWLFLLSLLAILGASAGTALAQRQLPSRPSTYWQYDAPGPLQLVATADFDSDGIAEFLLTTEDSQVVLLNAAGEHQWSYQIPQQATITQLTPINVDGATNSDQEILLATEDRLILLDQYGERIWEHPLELPPLPTFLLQGGSEGGAALQQQAQQIPVALLPFDRNADGNQEILVALQSGLLQLYDGQGNYLWQFPETPPDSEEPRAQVAIADVNRDGQDEILFSYYVRFSKLFLLDGERNVLLDKSVSGRVTALSLVDFSPERPLDIAIGNSFRRGELVIEAVIVYDSISGSELWYRTPNREVTSLAVAQLPSGPALLVGSSAGTMSAYDGYGRRVWRYLPDSPERAVVSISTNPNGARENQAAVAVTLAPAGGPTGDVILLSNHGESVQAFFSAASSGQTQLVDVNRDGISELLLASFGTLSLADPGTGARKNTASWEGYPLLAAPSVMLAGDLDQDDLDELLVGTSSGQLHMLESDTGQASWLQPPLGGPVTQLALVPASESEGPYVVVVHDAPNEPDDPAAGRGSWVSLWQPGHSLWSEPVVVDGGVRDLVVGNITGEPASEIILGSGDGQIITLSLTGQELWRTPVADAVAHLLLLDGDADGQMELFATTDSSEIYRFNSQGAAHVLAYYNLHEIKSVSPLPYIEGSGPGILMSTVDGSLRAISWQGAQAWRRPLELGNITLAQPAGDAFLVATADGRLLYIDANAKELWQEDSLGEIRDLYWGDLDGGGPQDLAVGNSEGDVFLYTSEQRPWDSLQLGSSVFGLAGLRSAPDEPAQLAAITDNGIVQLFEATPNRPPLLVNPRVEVGPGRYLIHVKLLEEDEDKVLVSLETYDEGNNLWRVEETRTASEADDLTFSLAPVGNEPVRYRFTYDDGTHQGQVQPAVGPPPQPLTSLRGTLVGPLLAVVASLSALVLVRQALSTESRTGRFYNRLKQQPAATLELIEAQYRRTGASPDFLLNLANRARSDRNGGLANLADGLFLLPTRPSAALSIINSGLAEARSSSVPWRHLDIWQAACAMAQALLEAPTITELSLLRPQLVQLVQAQDEARQNVLGLEPVLRVLTSLSDSERVELASDRTVYLHEAAIILRQIGERLPERPVTINNQIVTAIRERCLGLVKAEIEMLRGQAQLFLSLKTKRVVPEDGRATIALEVENAGRSAAENIVVMVEEDPAYSIQTAPQVIPVLSPGRHHEVAFVLEPNVDDRLRIPLKVRYDDRIQHDRQLAFADMVHFLPPTRDFTPILNPYMPGTPLRGNSPLFYGREDLFEFIIENAGRISGRNALILVGQRRTGKTSALLRLEHRLPENLLPVYVDCQSLGVLPGMAALLHDLAWLIADSLALRGYDIQVPDPATWREDPAGQFRRAFIPAVQERLPPGTTLLLVFDEFEAFENLVNDKILPATFFTFMRHLMQHSQGLSFVFVGTRRLEEMSSDYWSVLFNIALYRQIGFLDREAATKLIQEPVSPHIIYDDLALDKVWRVTAGHPYFLQLVCYTLVKRANSQKTGYVTISDVNAALEEMLRLGEVHFAYIWQRSSHTERALLTAVAHLMEREVPFHPSDLVQYLEQYGFRFDPAEVTAGLNRLVEREIMRELPSEGTTLYELKIGLVALWAEQNKSLSKLYESRTGAENGQKAQARTGLTAG